MSYEISFRAKSTDLLGFARVFPDRWSAYLRASGLCPAEIAVAFGVDQRTAQNWLEGLVAPRGAVVALAALREPERFAEHFGRAA